MGGWPVFVDLLKSIQVHGVLVGGINGTVGIAVG